MATIEKDLSYFSLRLQELLRLSFPELSGDKAFIAYRSELAAQAYETEFLGGNPIEQCNEIADLALLEGLYFSRFDTVLQVVCWEFDTIMADEELRPFALKMLPVCAPVFEEWVLTADFADSPQYELLYTELTGTIQIYIEENGLQ